MTRVLQWRTAGSNGFLLALAIGAGLVAAVIVFVVVARGDDNSTQAPAITGGVPVLMAVNDIPVGVVITSDMVQVSNVPESLLIKGAFSQPILIVGDVARTPIAAGEQITPTKIGLPVPDKGLGGVVPAGMRGVSVKVDEVTAVGGNLLPGDHVDIVATVRINRAPNLAEGEHLLRTSTILQNVEVLSVAQEAQKPGAQALPGSDSASPSIGYTSGQLPSDVEEQPDAATITLALTPDQAQALISAQEEAISVWAILRSFGDQTTAETAPYEVVVVDN